MNEQAKAFYGVLTTLFRETPVQKNYKTLRDEKESKMVTATLEDIKEMYASDNCGEDMDDEHFENLVGAVQVCSDKDLGKRAEAAYNVFQEELEQIEADNVEIIKTTSLSLWDQIKDQPDTYEQIKEMNNENRYAYLSATYKIIDAGHPIRDVLRAGLIADRDGEEV